MDIYLEKLLWTQTGTAWQGVTFIYIIVGLLTVLNTMNKIFGTNRNRIVFKHFVPVSICSRIC